MPKNKSTAATLKRVQKNLNKRRGVRSNSDFKKAKKPIEESDLQELSSDLLKRYSRKADRSYDDILDKTVKLDRTHSGGTISGKTYDEKRRRLDRMHDNRLKGLLRANKKIAMKEETDLQEISRDKLYHYATRAPQSADIKGTIAGGYDWKAGEAGDRMYRGSPEAHIKQYYKRKADKMGAKAARRDDYAYKAKMLFKKRKNVKEENELQELSKALLARYVGHANVDNGFNNYRFGRDQGLEYPRDGEKSQKRSDARMKQMDRDSHKIGKRSLGIQRATAKLAGTDGYGYKPKVLAKEETDLQELSKDLLTRYSEKARRDAIDTDLRYRWVKPIGLKGIDAKIEDATRAIAKKHSEKRRRGEKLASEKIDQDRNAKIHATEEVDLQELSSTYLSNYLRKTDDPEVVKSKYDKSYKKGFSTDSGRKLAISKLKGRARINGQKS